MRMLASLIEVLWVRVLQLQSGGNPEEFSDGPKETQFSRLTVIEPIGA